MEEANVKVRVVLKVQVLSLEGGEVPWNHAIGEALRHAASSIEQPDTEPFPEEGKKLDVEFELKPTPREVPRLSVLTPRQQAVLVFIRQYWHLHRVSPSLREISGAMGLSSTNAASELIQRLERKGYITIHKGMARGIVPREE